MRRYTKALTRVGALSLVLLLVAISFISTVAIGHVHYGVSLASSTTTTSYSVGWDFYVVVNYSRVWNVYYQGYASSNIYAPTNHGNYSGYGPSVRVVGVNGTMSRGLSLCVAVQKEDNSTRPLYASLFLDNPDFGGVNYRGNTSEPFGGVNLCIGVGPY